MSSPRLFWCVVGTHVLLVKAKGAKHAREQAAARMNKGRRTADLLPSEVHATRATDAQIEAFRDITGKVPA